MLIQGLLQKDPSQRIDLLELCMHPFWQGELASLADTFDTRESLVSYTSTSMATSVMEEENTAKGIMKLFLRDNTTLQDSCLYSQVTLKG